MAGKMEENWSRPHSHYELSSQLSAKCLYVARPLRIDKECGMDGLLKTYAMMVMEWRRHCELLGVKCIISQCVGSISGLLRVVHGDYYNKVTEFFDKHRS
jgi:hypothetical protein